MILYLVHLVDFISMYNIIVKYMCVRKRAREALCVCEVVYVCVCVCV